MGLRITGGQWRGRVINTPKHNHVRPTTSRMRESLFSRLQWQLANTRFLDGYAGSGIMGLEALSRGASYVCAIEQNRQQAIQCQQNGALLGASPDHHQVITGAVENILAKPNGKKPFDIIYLDPPYPIVNQQWWDTLSPLLGNWLTPEGICLLEVPAKHTVDWPENHQRFDYGDSAIIQIKETGFQQ